MHPDLAEDRVRQNRFKSPGPAFADYCSFLTSEKARSARMPQSLLQLPAVCTSPEASNLPTASLFLVPSEDRTLAATTEQVSVPAARLPHPLETRLLEIRCCHKQTDR